MKAIICSVDGVPVAVAVVNDDDGGELAARLTKTHAFDRVDVLGVDTPADLVAEAESSDQA